MAMTAMETFLDLAHKCGVTDRQEMAAYVEKLRAANQLPGEPSQLAAMLVRDGLLTNFQAEQLLAGRWKGFQLGKYAILERLGTGGMGAVYLAEHRLMKRRVALKVLPRSKAAEPGAIERFYREAKAVAAVDHPNIVRAHDIDHEGNLHFLVMEYVDGSSLQDVVRSSGPMNWLRAAHYIRQAATGLQHAHQAGLIHRDIKPGNLLVNRKGVVKILDMGLARFFSEEVDAQTRKYEGNVCGTADYLSPEQATDSHTVDIRSDIYSLGCTLYFLLSGRPPFQDGTVAQKLVWHQTRQPRPLLELCPDVPPVLLAIVEKMMAKDMDERYQTPAEVELVLEPLVRKKIPPPNDDELPKLCPAAKAPRSDPKLTAADIANADTAVRLDRPTKPSPESRVAGVESSKPRSSSAGTKVVAGVSKTQLRPPDATGPETDFSFTNHEPQSDAAPLQVTKTAPKAGAEEDSFDFSSSPAAEPAASPKSAPSPTVPEPAFQPRYGRPKTKPAAAKTPAGRKLLVGGGIGGLLLVGLAAGTVWYFMKGSPSPDKGATGSSIASSPATAEKKPVYVSKAGDGDVHTIGEAVEQAKSGDRVVVRDEEVYEENLHFVGKELGKKNLSIEAETTFTLRPPKTQAAAEALLRIERVDGLKLKGFILDGQGRVNDLVSILGACPGLVLEDIQLQGFQQNGIHLTSCQGTRGNEVRLIGLRIEAKRPQGQAAQAGMLFDPAAGGVFAHQAIIIRGCRFDGPMEASVRMGAAMSNCVFEQNVFFGGQKNAFVYSTDSMAGYVLRNLQIVNNTFCQFQHAVFFQPMPHFNSTMEFRNNLFYQIKGGIGQVQGATPVLLGDLLTGEGNIRDAKSPAGNLPIQEQPLEFELPTTSSKASNFLRFPKDSPLAEAGQKKGGGNVPVGALPPLD